MNKSLKQGKRINISLNLLSPRILFDPDLISLELSSGSWTRTSDLWVMSPMAGFYQMKTTGN